MINNHLLALSARGAQPRIADAMFRGQQQGNALRKFEHEQEARNALASVAPLLASGGPEAAMNELAQLGQFEPAYKIYSGQRDRAYRQQKLDRPQSSLGKLEADYRSGRISEPAYRAKIASIGKGGTTVNVNTGNIPLGKKPTNAVTSDLVSGRKERVGLGRIRELYDPSFLTYRGQAEGALTRFGEKLGADKVIPKENKRKLRQQTQFKQQVQQSFNEYRRRITGAAAAMSELESLQKALFNLDQSPTEFEAALDNYESMAGRLDSLLVEFLQKGIDPNTPEGGKAFDDALFGGAQDAPASNAPVNYKEYFGE